MRTRHLALVVSICGALGLSTPAVASQQQAGDVIPGRYIVMVEQGHDADDVARGRDQQVFDALNGFAATLDAAQVRALRRSARVELVEQDRVVEASATQSIPSDPWGLDRIDQRALPLSRTYTYNTLAANVTAYVIDTGIATSNADFGGRASNVYDAFGGNGQDCNGHGTHVAGTIGGSNWGVAKGVKLRGVRVLNCSGSGSTSGIVAALDWVRGNAVRPAVANMSLGGGLSSALNNATNSLANSGVFVAVAAGNENQNACNVSPASAAAAYTTAASDRSDRKASFSNWGSCVDAYAPGVSIRSAWLNNGANTISGTSMASPHVAGVAALYKGTFGEASSSTVSSWITNNATTNVISGNRTGTPNRLLYKSTL
jgi:subtilisin family serine protease